MFLKSVLQIPTCSKLLATSVRTAVGRMCPQPNRCYSNSDSESNPDGEIAASNEVEPVPTSPKYGGSPVPVYYTPRVKTGPEKYRLVKGAKGEDLADYVLFEDAIQACQKTPWLEYGPLSPKEKRISLAHVRAVAERKLTYKCPESKNTVFTISQHLYRGECCGNGCRHCPYELKNCSEEIKSKRIWNGSFYVTPEEIKTIKYWKERNFKTWQWGSDEFNVRLGGNYQVLRPEYAKHLKYLDYDEHQNKQQHYELSHHRSRPPTVGIHRRTRLNVVDNSALGKEAHEVGKPAYCIWVYKAGYRKRHMPKAVLGDKVLVAIRGQMKKAFVVGANTHVFWRKHGIPSTDTNNIVLLDDDGNPLGNRVTAPIPVKLLEKKDKAQFAKVLALANKFF
ncbi:hypothetical protein WR25_09286 [Diploscapter pachys]|uniref:Large ribosomal subunit protein uL14m n=1 Tax=Diploscapter pachys TaxID=2018661 RepID=A0A2A2LE74_9BILA|nr:hypothetical protein WR25_09286 [Diploscapter pachys]